MIERERRGDTVFYRSGLRCRDNPMNYRHGTGQNGVTETIRYKSASALARPAVIARLYIEL